VSKSGYTVTQKALLKRIYRREVIACKQDAIKSTAKILLRIANHWQDVLNNQV